MMDPSKDIIPPRLLSELKVAVASVHEKIEGDESFSTLILGGNRFVHTLNDIAENAASILERFGQARKNDLVDADTQLGKILGVQAAAQNLAVALMVASQNPDQQNAMCLFTTSRLLAVQSFSRFLK